MKKENNQNIENTKDEISNIKKYKSCNHKFILYPDDESHVKALQMLEKEYEICYILHDKDIYTEHDIEDEINKGMSNEEMHKVGDLKKPHWHVWLKTANQTWNTSLCKKLKINMFYCQQVNDYFMFARYLVHKDSKEKYQYSLNELRGSLTGKVKTCIAKDLISDNEDKCMLIREYFDSTDKKITRSEFDRWIGEHGVRDIVNRNNVYYLTWLREHNEEVIKKKKEKNARKSYQVVTSLGTFDGYHEVALAFNKCDCETVKIIEVIVAGVHMPVFQIWNIEDLMKAVQEEEN